MGQTEVLFNFFFFFLFKMCIVNFGLPHIIIMYRVLTFMLPSCSRSLIKLYQYDEIKISDFNIMPTLTTATAATPASTVAPNLTTASSLSQFSVIVLTVPDSITRCRFIEVISLPEYIVTHHVSVASKCWLVKPQEGLEVRK